MANKEKLTVAALQRVGRVSDAQLSPDGSLIAFVISTPDLEKNRMVSNIWLAVRATGVTRQLTFASEGKNRRPRWSPDGRAIAFLSDRAQGTQLWLLPVDGGEARQLTKLATEIDTFIWAPDGQSFAIVSNVYPDCKDAKENEARKKEREESPNKMRVIDDVPFRRWDDWVSERRAHIFIMALEGGEPRDLTPGAIDCPAWDEGGPDALAFSPDGQEICFVRAVGNEALHDQKNLFTVSVQGGEPVQITDNRAHDFLPRYSPDGRYIGYLATRRPFLDGDHAHLTIFDRQSRKSTRLTAELDRSVSGFFWSPQADTIWFTVEDEGEETCYRLTLSSREMVRCGRFANINDAAITSDGRHIIFTSSSFDRPGEVYQTEATTEMYFRKVTGINDSWLESIEWGEVSLFSYHGWNDEKVASWLVKPPGFDPTKRYPLLLFIHGGPHRVWGNDFHFRWNAQVFAAAGYIVLIPNFHGSSSFGQAFTDSIRGNWGEIVFEDLMRAVDEAAKLPFVDAERMAAAGGSYGGYMANWVAGHTDRFRCIVSHSGLFDLVSSFYAADFVGGAMEELGGTPWEKIEQMHRSSPSSYASNFKTPMLVSHGQQDFRVDISDSYALFQVLKAKGVPAKFLYFPNENHWILKPAHSVSWYKEVLAWLDRWVKN